MVDGDETLTPEFMMEEFELCFFDAELVNLEEPNIRRVSPKPDM